MPENEWVGDSGDYLTDYFGFQRLRGQSPTTNDYAFTDRDRVLLDALLNVAVNSHQHTGDTRLTNPLNEATPSETISLVQAASGGAIPAGLLMCYRVSFYDATGETVASPEETIQMPDPVSTPTQPTLATTTTGGTLTAGFYMYTLSAVKSNGETFSGDPAAIVVPTTTSTNKITITFPSAPSGATHWNIYRKKDSGHWYYTHQEVVASPTYNDTGDANVTEGLPSANTTNSENKVTITLSGYPAGATGYRIYRTTISGNYGSYSLLEDSDVGDLNQEDIYQDPGYGMPLGADTTYGSPPKVNLASEVQGHLPTSHITPLDANLDFAKYQGLNLVFHRASTAPGTPATAQAYWDNEDEILYLWNGASWVAFVIGTNKVWASPVFFVPGSLWDDSLATPTIKVCNIEILPATNLTIDKVYARVKTAPVAGATPVSSGVRVDVLKNGVSIFTSDGDKPLIANGTNADESATPTTTALIKNDILTTEIETIDDTHTAADLGVWVRTKQSLTS